MLPASDFKVLIAEADIMVTAAHAAAQSFARHGVVPSQDIDEIIKYLDEAGELLAELTQLSGGAGIIFHGRVAANDDNFIHHMADDITYAGDNDA